MYIHHEGTRSITVARRNDLKAYKPNSEQPRLQNDEERSCQNLCFTLVVVAKVCGVFIQ